jgi:hypothetical protein
MKGKKYPHTPYAPWCEYDDIDLSDGNRRLSYGELMSYFDQEVVALVKLDGECCGIERHRAHARSLDGKPAGSRVKPVIAGVQANMPETFKVWAENLEKPHIIKHHQDLVAFNIFDGEMALSFDEFVEWADLLGLPTPDVIYRGIFDVKVLKKLSSSIDTDKQEGFVVRKAKPFCFDDFGLSVFKYVTPEFKRKLKVAEHWLWG